MTRPLSRRLVIAVTTIVVASLAACTSPTAPAPTDGSTALGGTYGGSSTKLCGGTYGGSSTC